MSADGSAAALRPPGLSGRGAELWQLDQLAAAVRAGQSRALVLCGEPGIGKTALLDCLASSATDFRVERAAGIQSEMELAYAGLHQLCSPMLDYLDALPRPQRDALGSALGVSTGPAPDRFLVGLAVLNLLSAVAERSALLCIVDDAHWLDQASAQVLAFVARRLEAEGVGLVFAASTRTRELAGLPELAIPPLQESDARMLLDTVLAVPLDSRVRDQLLAEARGNPLALLELPSGRTAEQLAGGFGLPVPATGPASRVEESFRQRVVALPDASRTLLLLAAADPTGDAALVWRAAARLGVGADAAAPAVDAGLAEFDTRVRFRHPLVRSAAYRTGSTRDRQQAHRALADVTDEGSDPERRAWHRAHAAAGLDEEAAAALERLAARARARGGAAAAAAFLERAATLTPDPAERSRRALTAAEEKLQAGAYEAARDLLTVAESGPVSAAQAAAADVVRARLALLTGRGSDAPALLLAAARRLAPADAALSRATYLEALSAGIFAGQLADPDGSLRTVARAAAAAPAAEAERAPDLLLDGLAAYYLDGYAAGVPVLRRAVDAYGAGLSASEELRWSWLACLAALHIWDDGGWERLSCRYLERARQVGALSELPLALSMRAFRLLMNGKVTAADSLVTEAMAATAATGGKLAPYGALSVAALQGDEAKAGALVDATSREASQRGDGAGIAAAGMATALLYLGRGRYAEAVTGAELATASSGTIGTPPWALSELIEAAARSGKSDLAADGFARLAEMTAASGTDWALGMQARAQALLCDGAHADDQYQEAITRLSRTGLRICRARAHLLYGEWLRRERRRTDARDQLRMAHGMFEAMGVAAFAERARRELSATGETARKRALVTARMDLTAQEAQIARLAREGLSNPEIGTRLFISTHTVQYHLRKVFAKLGINSRSQLDRVLPDDG